MEDEKREDHHAIYLGNLHNGTEKFQLKQQLVSIFQLAGMTITTQSVCVKRIRNKTFAFIFLHSDDEVQNALNFLQVSDLKDITNPSEIIIINRKRPTRDRSTTTRDSSGTSHCSSQVSPVHIEGPSTHKQLSSNESSNPTATLDFTMDPQNKGHSYRTHQAFIERNFDPRPEGIRRLTPASNPPATSSDSIVTHSQRAVTLRHQKGYYIHNEKLGNENRQVEYKAAQGNFVKHQLHDTVARYVCSFLNSEGGSLMLGVNDEGYVLGVPLTHHNEDLVRQKIDHIITRMYPHVFPNMYKVQFVPVMDALGALLEDLKVIEITVSPGTEQSHLYQTLKGEVFIRRDGSVQGPLKAAEIQRWTRLVLQEQLERTNQSQKHVEPQQHPSHVRLYSELQLLKEETMKQKEHTLLLEKQLNELKQDNKLLEEHVKKRSHSRICVIM